MVAEIESSNIVPADSSTETARTTSTASMVILPQAKYTLVGIDIDTTGRRLIDEIIQLAAYTPHAHFEQYIMPYMNLNPAARQRHQVRVITIGFYRMLKSMQTYKIIKSKSEIAAIKDFLNWLEFIKKNDIGSNGVILVYHEKRKFIPYMILESLKKYNLLDRFLETVKSFANGLNLAGMMNTNGSLKNYSLRSLSKFLTVPKKSTTAPMLSSVNGTAISDEIKMKNNIDVNENEVTSTSMSAEKTMQQVCDENNQSAGSPSASPKPQRQQKRQSKLQERELFDGSASVRAKLVFDVAHHLTNRQQKDALVSNGIVAMENMLNGIHQFAQPISCDLDELEMQNLNLERQNSFRPVFLNYFKTTLYHRVRAVKFRIVLAENGYDLQTLNKIWSEKRKEGLAQCIQSIEDLKQKDMVELIALLDSYYDPSKDTITPIVNSNRRRNRRGVRNNKENEGCSPHQGSGDKEQPVSADPTAKSPNSRAKATKPLRSRRTPRSRKIHLLSQKNGVNKTLTVVNNNTSVTSGL